MIVTRLLFTGPLFFNVSKRIRKRPLFVVIPVLHIRSKQKIIDIVKTPNLKTTISFQASHVHCDFQQSMSMIWLEQCLLENYQNAFCITNLSLICMYLTWYLKFGLPKRKYNFRWLLTIRKEASRKRRQTKRKSQFALPSVITLVSFAKHWKY